MFTCQLKIFPAPSQAHLVASGGTTTKTQVVKIASRLIKQIAEDEMKIIRVTKRLFCLSWSRLTVPRFRCSSEQRSNSIQFVSGNTVILMAAPIPSTAQE